MAPRAVPEIRGALSALVAASASGCMCFTPVDELSDGGASDSGCGHEVVIDSTRGGRASALWREGTLHVVFQAADGGDVLYAQCGPACDGRAPRFSAPARVGTGTAAVDLRPLVGVTASGIVAVAWRTDPLAGELREAECAAGCDQASSWSSVALEVPIGGVVAGDALGFSVSGERRVLVAMRGNPPTSYSAGVVLAECEGACSSSPSAWSPFTLVSNSDTFGASVALQTLPGGSRRLAVWGGGPASAPEKMLYREYTSADWSDVAGGFLGPGVFPSIVVDREGLPRVFFLSSAPVAALKVARCTKAPCATPMPAMWSPLTQWTTTTLEPAAGHFTAGVLPDGRTAYSVAVSGVVVLGVETQDGSGYDHLPADSCASAISGEGPVTIFDASGAPHSLVSRGPELVYVP